MTSEKLRRSWHWKIYFLKLHIYVYLRTVFRISRQEAGINFTPFHHPLPPLFTVRRPKKSTKLGLSKILAQYICNLVVVSFWSNGLIIPEKTFIFAAIQPAAKWNVVKILEESQGKGYCLNREIIYWGGYEYKLRNK